MTPLLEVKSLSKSYDGGIIEAVKDVSFSLSMGKIYALTGPSGCGKSTLINLIGTLDKPEMGKILYEGKTIDEVGELNIFRRTFFGFVFQFHHLIPVLTLLENVESALLSRQDLSSSERREKAIGMLRDFEISHRANNFAKNISGGERQRGSIARALVNDPKIILADEPTGNVDSKNASHILSKMRIFIDQHKAAMLIATHDPNVALKADVIMVMKDGKIISINEKTRISMTNY